MFGRPGETVDDFTTRCLTAANDLADKETAALRDKYGDKVTRLQTQIQAAEDRAEVLDTERKGRRARSCCRQRDRSSAGCSVGVEVAVDCSVRCSARPAAPPVGAPVRDRQRSARSRENKLEGLHRQLEDLETELTQEVTDIDAKWMAAAKNVTDVAGRPGTHRREGHPARPCLDPCALTRVECFGGTHVSSNHSARVGLVRVGRSGPLVLVGSERRRPDVRIEPLVHWRGLLHASRTRVTTAFVCIHFAGVHRRVPTRPFNAAVRSAGGPSGTARRGLQRSDRGDSSPSVRSPSVIATISAPSASPSSASRNRSSWSLAMW